MTAEEIRIRYHGMQDFMRAYTDEVELGGVFLETVATPPVGSHLGLVLEIEDGKGFTTHAEVVSHEAATDTRRQGMRLRFVGLDDGKLAWLERHAKEHLGERKHRDPFSPAHQMRDAVGVDDLVDNTMDRSEVASGGSDSDDDIVVGIDLGTSTCAVSIFKNGEPIVLDLNRDNPLQAKTVPSVLSFNAAGEATIGADALEGLDKNAKRTVYGSKRFLGRVYDNFDVQRMLGRYPYKIVSGAGGKCAIDINGRALALPTIAAKLLTHVRRLAQNHPEVQRPVSRAVVTVPAYYNQNQRDAVVHAGKLAGLEVQRIINEPTAAALAYGLTYNEPKTVLVYDLGGGTFDVSVMAVDGPKLTVLSTAGDTFLGGEDFDDALVGHVCRTFEEATGNRLSRNHQAIARLKIACESAKRRLSARPQTMVAVRNAILSHGETTRVEVEIDRATFEGLIDPLVNRTLEICAMAMVAAKRIPAQIDEVVLVGGQTNMPHVRTRVAEHFRTEPKSGLPADEVVAMGAGLLPHLGRGADAELHDVLSMTIGIGIRGKFVPLMRRNTPLPHKITQRLRLPANALSTYSITIFQGDSDDVHRNEQIGVLTLDGIDPAGEERVIITVDFNLSADCRLTVVATNVRTGQSWEVELATQYP